MGGLTYLWLNPHASKWLIKIIHIRIEYQLKMNLIINMVSEKIKVRFMKSNANIEISIVGVNEKEQGCMFGICGPGKHL